MTRTIKLSFITDQDEVGVITIPRAKAGLEDDVESVKTAMAGIIDTEIVNMTAGKPVSPKKAQVVEVDTKDFKVEL